MRELGLTTSHDLIVMARCLSLTDAFWMKWADEAITWDDVSLYRNPLTTRLRAPPSTAWARVWCSSAIPRTAPIPLAGTPFRYGERIFLVVEFSQR